MTEELEIFLVESRIVFLHVIQTDSGVHTSSYSIGTGRFWPEGKAAGE
jgi:hypothetical protein